MNEKNSFSAFQKEIDKWVRKHGGYWGPLSMLAAIIEEIGELARQINHNEGYKPKKNKVKDKNNDGIQEEITDVLFALICLANYYEINLEDNLRKTIKKFSQRDANRFS
jgi:NTP pyrophosphatase (non-canonical NTP hydrolase)